MDSLLQKLQPALSVTLIICLIPLLLLLNRRKPPYPPGPRGLPLVGNMNMTNQLTHRSLAKLGKKYGGIFYLRIGFLDNVAISNPEAARQVLKIHDIIFSNRPANLAVSYLTYNRADLAFSQYGPFWRQMRKLCVMKLFSRKRAESWQTVRDEVNTLVRTVAANSGKPVNIGELVFKLTRKIIYRSAFGSSSQEGQDEFIAIMEEFSELFGAFNIADFIPWLAWADPQGLCVRLVKARQTLDKFIDKVIDDHLQRRSAKTTNNKNANGDEETDLVDELLAFYSKEQGQVEESENMQNFISLTKENVKAIIMDIMFGGTETVGSTIEWAMTELMRSPEDLRKVQQELTEVVGLERSVEDSDFDKLTYLRCAIKEVLRLRPPIPLLLHETAEDVVVCGYFVPKKARVMINVWAIGRDPESWEDPETFKPSRFLKDGMPDFKGGDFEFIPFGSGRRSCPGMLLGLYTLELAVAHLLHNFTWELPDGMKPSELDIDYVVGLGAIKSSRLVATSTKRVTCPI